MPTSDLGRKTHFTTFLPSDDYLWTAGFFNERFPDVVSPLGWSVVRRLVEQAAFREPLSFVGYQVPADYPLTRLYRGHVYANVGVFQRLYRVFPRALVPRDAGRYFPNADTSLRLAVAPPPPIQLVLSLVRTLTTEPGWHPLNYLVWQRFIRHFDARVRSALSRIDQGGTPAALLQVVDRLLDASLGLLRLHRWSLTYADVLYDLLERLVSAWVDAGDAREISADLISGLPNRSTETDIALWKLARQAARLDATSLNHLRAGDVNAFLSRLHETSAGLAFQRAFQAFLAGYGHRSPSLDIWYPAYADDPAGLLQVVVHLLDGQVEDPTVRERVQAAHRRAALRQVRKSLGGLSPRWWAFRLVLWFAQRYTVLREDQRFYWQKSMHAKRRAFLRIGQALAAGNALATEDDIFFLTLNEVTGLVRGWLPKAEISCLVTARRDQFEQLHGAPYPAFLRGEAPLSGASRLRAERVRQLVGLPASPGRARGPALVVRGPGALDEAWRRASSGDILVTSSTDPAWTPLFLRVKGLVMERGGQLSHGAVVAREYGLPAAVGVAGALDHIAEGDIIEVDGSTGTVTLLQPAQERNTPPDPHKFS